MTKTTIIIPIYNGFEYIEPCLKSVLASTDSSAYELLLINDSSSDKRVKEFLDSSTLLKQPHIKILHNKENLGFVKTCNIGIRSTENDVLLLNSDTEVTANWLEKITKKAYSSDSIATVTPYTNNGAITSMPKFMENNELPEGYDPNGLNRLVESTSWNVTPALPSAVGFAMFIKRKVINEIGYFNEELFGKGYGEENDFSLRAHEMGYVNTLDDSTFVYHKGNVSFQTGESFSSENSAKLDKLYPYYNKWVFDFVHSAPLRNQLNLIDLYLSFGLDPKKQTILFLKHHEFTIGGTGVQVKTLAENLKNYNCIILSMLEDDAFIQIFGKNGAQEFKLFNKDNLNIRDYQEKVFEFTALFFNAQLIHINHLMGMKLNLLSIPKKLGIKTFFSYHDIYMLQESFDDLIKISSKDPELKSEGYKKYLSSYLENIDFHIFPSGFLCDLFIKKVGIDKAKTQVIPHGSDLEKIIKTKIEKGKILNVAFVGAATKHKGIELYLKLIAHSKEKGLKVNFYVLGFASEDLAVLSKQYGLKTGWDYKHFTYNNSESQKILQKYDIDLAIMPNLIPESFSYVLSEAFACGIPVIAENIGAIAERIGKAQGGWVYEDYKELVKKFEEIIANPELLNPKIEEINKLRILTKEEMVEEYKNLYDHLVPEINDSKSNLLLEKRDDF